MFFFHNSAPPHCEYTDSPGRYLPVADKFIPRVYTHEDCRRSCDTEPEFQCRAFSFHAYRRECLLSSDDTHSSGTALVSDQDFFYGERGTCNNGDKSLHTWIYMKKLLSHYEGNLTFFVNIS